MLGPLTGIFSALFGLIANILATITGSFLSLAVAIFNWVLSDNFISLSYTKLDNPFIQVGWTFTRDLTNIVFIIALVAIGLGTALRIKDYQASKALPILIGIALLINFTPVLLGLIVDSSNILMNFFTQGGFAGGNAFTNFATTQWGNIGSLVGGLKFWDPLASNEARAAATGSFVLIFFNLIAALVYLLFAAILIIRYVAIWTLVILSPFAFACQILPATKKVFGQWWKLFLQWSFVGVIATFFLYLADHIIRITTRGDFLSNASLELGDANPIASLVQGVLPYFISIIFLFIGLFASLSFAPKGADAVMKAGQKGINKASQIYGKAAWDKTKSIGKGIATAPSRAMRDYKTARATGLSKGQASWAATSRPTRRFFRQIKPPIPQAPAKIIKTYKTAKALGFSRKDAVITTLNSVGKSWNSWKQGGVKTRAASRGFQKAVKEVWGATIDKKTKLRRCPKCGSEVPQGAKKCDVCGFTYKKTL